MELEIRICRTMAAIAERMAADLGEEDFKVRAGGVGHRPAWIFGHLAVVADMGAAMLGAAPALPASWAGWFAPGSVESDDPSGLPGKEELLTAFRNACERLGGLVASATPADLAAPQDTPFLREAFPTKGDLLGMLLTGHMGLHVGQLSLWRHLHGRPALF